MEDILIPRSLLRDPDRFGGTREGDCQRGALTIERGTAVRLHLSARTDTPQMLLPTLTEPHCHLDKCHTIARIGPVAGDLRAAINAQSKDREGWTEEDVRRRAGHGLAQARAAGCGALRSHVDWGDSAQAPLAWDVLRELGEDAPEITLQLSPLMGIDRMADKAFCHDVARQASATHGALGAFVLDHDRVDEGLRNMINAAETLGLPLDFHVDEGLGDFNGLERIADAILNAQFQGPVLCGHAVSLMDRHPDSVARIADKLMRAGIAVCALPTTNLYLQDRRKGTPERRGITRLRELRTAGVRVLTGSDNVGDAFCPMGQFDPMAALHLAALTAHLDPPMGDWLPMITTHAREAMGLDPLWVDGAPMDGLRRGAVPDTCALVAGRTPLHRLPVAGSA